MKDAQIIPLVGIGVGALFGLGAVSTLQAASAAGSSGASAAQSQLMGQAVVNGGIAAAIVGVSYHFFKKAR